MVLGIVVICVNIFLMLVKIAAGIFGNSYALIADGIESGCDIFTSMISWIGFHLSLKPADHGHPYGHGKIESIAGIFSGLSLLGAAGVIAYNSVLEIQSPHGSPEWFTLPVLILVVIIKWTLSLKVRTIGRKYESNALKGDGWHHLSDALTSLAAAVGISIAMLGGNAYEAADDWAALLACLIIITNGGFILKSSFHDLIDGTVPDEFYESVRSVAAAIPGVENTEKCRIRKSGIDLFVEMHVRVKASLSVGEGHDIGHRVKRALISASPNIKDVVVHIEPA